MQEVKKDCGKEPVDTKKIYTVGCLELFEKQFTGNMGIVGGKTKHPPLLRHLVMPTYYYPVPTCTLRPDCLYNVQ